MAVRRRHRPRVVVTAGPSREHLDDVRFLSNGSTGRMGIELAREALRLGCDVTLLLGPTELAPPPRATTHRFVSTDDLLASARRAVEGAALVIFSAAPADWKPARRLAGKPPKASGAASLRLRPTPDVAALLGRSKGRRVHVGFALESGPTGLARALGKLDRKRFDAIVLNSPENLGRGGGLALWLEPRDLRARLRTPLVDVEPLPSRTKRTLARAILARALALLHAPGV